MVSSWAAVIRRLVYSLGAGALDVGGMTQFSVDVCPTVAGAPSEVVPEIRVEAAVSCDLTHQQKSPIIFSAVSFRLVRLCCLLGRDTRDVRLFVIWPPGCKDEDGAWGYSLGARCYAGTVAGLSEVLESARSRCHSMP